MLINRRHFIKISSMGSALAMLGNKSYAAAETDKNNRTKGLIDSQAPFSFAVVADPHCAEEAKPGLEQYGNGVTKFMTCVKEMEKLSEEEKPDFMLILGDIHLWVLKEHFDQISIPMHVISGNHEDAKRKKQMRELFPTDFGEKDYYAFVHKGVRFVGMCDARAQDHIGTLCSEDFGPRGQCEWLEEELAQKEQHKIIFAHIPTEPEGEDRYGYLSRNDSRYLNGLIQKHKPAAMFTGHQHRNTTQQQIPDTKSFIMRSCCWNGDETPIGFMLVKMNHAGITTREVFTGHYQ